VISVTRLERHEASCLSSRLNLPMDANPSARVTLKLRDWSLLLMCNLIWASQFVLVKLVQDEVGPLFTTAFPMLLATLLLVPVVGWTRRAAPPSLRATVRAADAVGFLTIGILGQVVAQLFATWGAQRSLASNAAVLSLALPVATALMAFLLLGERMTRVRWLGFALAIAGVLVSSGQDLRTADLGDRLYLLGNSMVFLGVLGSAFYNVYSKRMLTRFSPLEVLLGSYVAACLVLVPVALVVEPDGLARLATLSLRGWTGLLLLAVFQYCVSMLIFLTVLTRLDATQAAVSNYLIPGFGVVLAWLVLGERLPPAALVGGVLVLASTLLVTVWEDRLNARRKAYACEQAR
jgi:drug/metabolite transporter (DMT)-like permease